MALQPAAIDLGAGGPALDAYDKDRIAGVAMKAFARIADAWRLGNADASALIAVSPRTWARIKTGVWRGELNRDQLMRVSAATGLYKSLQLYFSENLADRWPTLRNTGPLFGGRTPVETMVEGGLPAMIDIRNYVDALRGGA